LQPLFIPCVFVSCSVPETVQDTHDGRVITHLREFASVLTDSFVVPAPCALRLPNAASG
jgi:hypothetical protein